MDEIELLKTELARERRARKQAEQLLEQKSLELFERNEELRHKAEALAHSNAELEQFAYVASHDLQAPLRTIAGFSGLLVKRCRDQLSEDGLEYLSYIDSGAKRLHRLIHDLLDYSRAGRTGYTHVMVSAQTLMDDLCRQLQSTLQQRNAEVIYSNLPQIYADQTQIARVFQNLLDNALKFQQPGLRPRVEVRAHETNRHWQFSIQDNGIGMREEHLKKIFGVFARLHAEDAYPGTGVGLAICMKIVERHGGRLWVESTPGVGTCFHFTLPKPAQPV